MLTEILHALVSRPWVYDRLQTLAGSRRVHQALSPYLGDTVGKLVLDIGGGTGRVARLLPDASGYVCLDNDLMKLAGLRQSHPDGLALLGNATALPFADKSVHVVTCIAVAHHLPPQAMARVIPEMCRVCRERLVFLDALRVPERRLSNLLWRYDRGSYPYTEFELLPALDHWFDMQRIAHLKVYHHYLLLDARPRSRRACPDLPEGATST